MVVEILDVVIVTFITAVFLTGLVTIGFWLGRGIDRLLGNQR